MIRRTQYWPSKRSSGTLVLLLVITAFVASCSRQDEAAVSLRAVGADSMAGLMKCWINEFEKIRPGVTINFEPALSADGALALINGQAHFSPFAREYFPLEVDAFIAEFGLIPELVQVAVGSYASNGKTHALGIYVNLDNPINGISIEQLRQIYTSAKPVTWADLGQSGELASHPVNAYGMINLRPTGNPPGIVNYLQRTIADGQALSGHVIQKDGSSGSHALEEIVNAVGDDPLAIGYSGFQFASESTKTIPVAHGTSGPYVSGTPSSVAAMHYPLARSVYIAVHPAPDRLHADATDRFLSFVHGDTGQQCVQDSKANFLPLPIHRRQRPTSLNGNQPTSTGKY